GVGGELRRRGLKGFTVHLKVRYPDFALVTRSLTLPFPTDQELEIYRTAVRLLERTQAGNRKARLLGVGMSNLRGPGEPEQLSIFDAGRRKAARSLEAVDRIRERFGPQAIRRASLLEEEDPGASAAKERRG
ncbi:MAG: DNA polymerase IV, partial [Deltaproteobacteria bacterium]|nr:DNA polymerase IV [Deltaproteobacteria bacterium]